MNEGDYLEEQAELGKAAIKKALGEILTDAGNVVDPRRWTEAHPWTMLGVAALTGLIATVGLVPNLRHKDGFPRSTNDSENGNGHHESPAPPESAAHRATADNHEHGKAEHPAGRFGKTIENLVKFAGVIRPLLASLLSAGVRYAASHASADDHAEGDPSHGNDPMRAVDPAQSVNPTHAVNPGDSAP